MTYEKKSPKQDVSNSTIGGHIGRLQDLKFFDSGMAVLNFSLGNSQDYWKGQGEGREVKEVTVWYDCVIRGKYAEAMAPVLKKAKYIVVNGHVSSFSYDEDKGKIYLHLKFDVDNINIITWKDGEGSQDDDDPEDENTKW